MDIYIYGYIYGYIYMDNISYANMANVRNAAQRKRHFELSTELC